MENDNAMSTKSTSGSTNKEVFVCNVSELDGISVKRFKTEDHDFILVKAKGSIYALDSFCYHAGGPLYMGDIEDFAGNTCLVCPWHRYKVKVDTGEMIYQSIDPHNLKKPPVLKCSSQKQRMHHTSIRGGDIYVTFTENTGVLSSDQYNTKEYREKFDLT